MSMRLTICPTLCRYYKPGKKEDPGCGGLEWLKIRPGLEEAVASLPKDQDDGLFGLADDDARLARICQICEFRVDSCDFRDPQVPQEECSPCGGLRAVAGLLAAGKALDL